MDVRRGLWGLNNFDSNSIHIELEGRDSMSEIKFEDFQMKYKFERELSRGSFGRVCRIREIESGDLYALKKLMVKSQSQGEDAHNEIQLMERLNHPSIVAIHEFYDIQIRKGYGRPQREIGIVMELAHASLHQMIHNKACLGNWNALLQQTYSIVEVLALLQKQNIAHRDIKPGNILVFETKEGQYRWKLADFGLAIDLNHSGGADKFAGSYEYASPKLRKKFKYSNLRITSNPFKDDVYSLGVTLLEIITGSRKYNEESRAKLEEHSPNKLLFRIIDMMLEENEDRRPCFKQLLMLLQEENISHELEPPQPTLRIKQASKSLKWNQSVEAKTVQKRDVTTFKIDLIEVSKKVQCIAPLGTHILCGCDDGTLIIVTPEQQFHLGNFHQAYVSQLCTDEAGNIWSCGGDRTLRIWKSKLLLKFLRDCDYEVREKKIKNIFKRESEWKVNRETWLNLSEESHWKFELPFSHQGGISAIECLDEERYVVGYFDGFVYASWMGEEFHGKLHSGPITGIQISEATSQIFTCGFDGMAKCIKIGESLCVGTKFYSENGFPIVSMGRADDSIGMLTLNGIIIGIDDDMNEISRCKLPISNVMSGVIGKECLYAVSETGAIVDGNEEAVGKLGWRGWNCLRASGKREMIAGSLEGKVARISW